jgi:hypothetical protein
VGSSAYKLCLLAHLACVIVGYGAVALDSLTFGRTRRLEGDEAYAVAQSGYTATVKWAGRFLYGVPVFGAAAVAASDGGIEFSEAWVSAAFVVWLVGVAVLHGVVTPARRRSLVLLAELAGTRVGGPANPTTAARSGQVGSLARRIAVGQAVFNLATVAALVLMVWKPGR